ncbi:MAG: DUF5687 family protein [Balneolaceae bacterium]
MSFFLFLKLQIQSKIRSVSIGRDLLSGIFLAFIILFLFSYIIWFSISLRYIIKDALEIDDAIGFVNGYLLFFFAGEFFYRFFLQKLPVTELQHYLHLPIKRWKIIHFLLQRSFFSLLNIVAILLLTPFAIMEVATVYSPFTAFIWLGTIVMISWVVHWIALIFKGEMGDRLSGMISLFIIYLLIFGAQYFDWYNAGELIKPFFDAALTSSVPFITGILMFTGAYYLAYIYYRNRAYEEDLTQGSGTIGFNPGLGFLSRFGPAGAFADIEWKLIFRHKKSRSYLYISGLFLLYGLLFYPNFDVENNPADLHLALFLGLFITGSFLFNYGQFYLSWNSANFDFFLVQKKGIESLIKGKNILFAGISAFFFLLSIPYVYFGWPILFVHLTAFIFNVGINIHLLTLLAFWKPKPMDINKRAMFNYEGIGAAQFLMFFPLMGIPYLIYLPFALIIHYQMGLMVLCTIGFMGILFHKKITRALVNKLIKNRHEISATFRQEI